MTIIREPREGVPERLEMLFTHAGRSPAKAMKKQSGDARAEVAESFEKEGPGWKKSRRAEGGGQTLRRTGRLERSITYRPAADSLTIGSSDVRARIHFYGGVIKPKRAKFLTIPYDETVKRPARDYDNTFAILKFMGSWVGMIFQKQAGGKLRPLFHLVKKVVIPARPYFSMKRFRPRVRQRMLEHYTGEGK